MYEKTADNLFAGCWQRRALRSLSEGNRDEGLLYYLKALKVKELKDSDSRWEAGQVIGEDYKKLMATYRHNSSVYSMALSPDGKTIMAAIRKRDTPFSSCEDTGVDYF